MKRLTLSALLTLGLLVLTVQPARADGFGFNVSFGCSAGISCNWNCGGCAPYCGCAPCYGFGPCFAPAYSTLGYGAPTPITCGYPGYPGASYGYAGYGYGYPQGGYGYAMPACAYGQ